MSIYFSICSHDLNDVLIINLDPTTMSNALAQHVTKLLSSADWHKFSPSIRAYLQALGVDHTLTSSRPADPDKQTTWDDANSRAMGNIRLSLGPDIQAKYATKTTAKELWDELEKDYGKPGIGAIFSEFKAMLDVSIPSNGDPGPALDKLQAHAGHLTLSGAKIEDWMLAMIIISKLPPTMDVVAQTYGSKDKITDLKTAEIAKSARLAFEQKQGRKGAQQRTSGDAQKISAIKRRGPEPAFKQQQQQRPSGSSSSAQKGKKPFRGSRGGKFKQRNNQRGGPDHAHIASSAIAAAVTDLPAATPDPRVSKPVINDTDTPVVWKTKRALELARDLGVQPNFERLRILESVIESTDRAKAKDNVDDSDNESRSSKRRRLADRLSEPLANRISSADDSDYESCVSIGGEEDDYSHTGVYDPEYFNQEFYDDLDQAIAETAGLAEDQEMVDDADVDALGQVPPTSPSHNDANMLHIPLPDLRVTLAGCNPCIVSFDENICAHSLDYSQCAHCKGKGVASAQRSSSMPVWLLDSGASLHFTNNMDDFVEYEPIDDQMAVATANGVAFIKGQGTVILNCANPQGDAATVRISPVYYIPELTARLLSLGTFLQNGLTVRGDTQHIKLYQTSGTVFLTCTPRRPNDTIYCVRSDERELAARLIGTVNSVDYDTMHRRFAHPSRDVLKHARKHTQQFPDIDFPKEQSICRGCAQGKMPSQHYPPNTRRATRPFQLIHSDLKQFPTLSYHKHEYAIIFYDDYTSFSWVVCMRKKSAAITATRQFIAMVKNQFKSSIEAWMTDGGGEYRSHPYDDMLKDEGIKILQSAPYTHQENGRAERHIRTLMDKEEAMRLDACLPASYWEFALEHASHVYNRTPVKRLGWRTPYELLHGEQPTIDHLRVFGCGAYVFIPKEARKNKMSPKSELMTYIGVAPGGHGDRFMRSPNNTIFTSSQALFDETLFPKCPESNKRQNTRLHNAPKPPSTKKRDDPERPPSHPSHDDDENDDFNNRPPTLPKKGPGAPQPGQHARSRSPPSPPPMDEQPQQEAGPSEPRRSGRERKVKMRPDNAYGETRHPTDIYRDIESGKTWRDIIGDEGRSHQPQKWSRRQVPGPSSAPAPTSGDAHDHPLPFHDAEIELLAKLCREGGVKLADYLLMKAIPPNGDAPSHANVREWTYRDIKRLSAAEQKEWIKACREELEALRRRKVYELVDRPKGRKVIKNRWVFDIKSDARKRARLVAKGFLQIEGLDFNEIFSPVVRFETVRLMLALAALENWHITGLDVRNAYLYGELEEEIYMEQPEGFAEPGQEHKVFRLRRALYGLKQAGLAWWRALDKSMTELGFKRLQSDAGIFIYTKAGSAPVVAIVYVDDALFCGPDKALVNKLKAMFMQKWECRDLGDVKEFLRMRIKRNGSKIAIDQCAYLEKVLQRCGMENAKPARTPLPTGYVAVSNQGPVDPVLRNKFQTVIGSLLYIMLGTRPDIAFAVTTLSRHAANPSQDHLNKALYICRYLIGTRSYSLVYDGASGLGLTACSDSDWANDPDMRRSVTGYFLKLANGIFSWTSRRQRTVALASTEAEYMAVSDCSRQVVWIRSLLSELGYKLGPIPICADNQGSLFIAGNPVTERRSKHIDIRYHYIRECIAMKKVEVFFIEGSENPADMFTKNLGWVKFEKFRALLGLHFT